MAWDHNPGAGRMTAETRARRYHSGFTSQSPICTKAQGNTIPIAAAAPAIKYYSMARVENVKTPCPRGMRIQ